MKPAAHIRVRALTLLEVVISIALIALLLGALLTFFWQALLIRDQAERAADRTQLVQQVLEHMAAELRASVGVEKINFPVQQFTGDRRSITFVTTLLPPAESYGFYRASELAYQPAPQQDLREVTYSLWIDPEETTEHGEPLVGGILRTERRALDPFLTEQEVPEDQDLLYLRHDLWSPELGYLEFRYFDGVEWTTRWEVTKGNPLPHLIQITVGFDSITKDELDDVDLEQYPLDRYPLGPDVPSPNRYSLIVCLPAADQMFGTRLNRLGQEVEEIYQFMAPGAGQPQGGGRTGGKGEEE
jgi:type II secretory pathway pseudopilin PulG